MVANRDFWVYIMIASLVFGTQLGLLGTAEMLPAPSWSNEKTPAWAWIANIVGTILCLFGLFLLFTLSGVTIIY